MKAGVLLLGLSLAACASGPDAEAADGVAIVVADDASVGEAELRVMARRELVSYATKDQRLADLADAAYAMERGLRAEGYAHAVVELVPSAAGPDSAQAQLRVAEGARTTLGELSFPGATVFDAERLRPFFPTRAIGLVSRAPVFRSSAIDGGIAEIERLYVLAGHHRVRVGPPAVTWDESRTRADVAVPIDEGPRYTVGRVIVKGRVPDSVKAAIEALDELRGRAYHVRVPAEIAARARHALLDAGHQFAEVTATAGVVDAKALAEITLSLRPGPVLRLRRVTVSGNDRTRPKFVKQRVPLEDGDLAEQAKLDRALNDLYATGVFRSVKTRFENREDAGGEIRADLVVEVEELEARSVELEAGWGSYELLRGRVGYRDRNLAGTGRLLDVQLSASLRSAGLEARVRDPHLLGPRNPVELHGGYQLRQEPSFESRLLSFQASVQHEFDREHFAKVGYTVRASEAISVDGSVRGAEEDGFLRSAGVFASGGRDTRDDKLYPGSGMLAELGLFSSSPDLGAELDFLETKATVAKYWELRKGTVLAVGGRVATKDVLDDRRTLPIQERLFLGGESTVRSFRESELGPANRLDEYVGGLTSAEAHVEVRQQVVGDFDAAVFYDIGAVSRRAWRLSRQRGEAIGVGLRYRLPVGPVRLDVGYNPGDRFAADRAWTLHVSFGFSF